MISRIIRFSYLITAASLVFLMGGQAFAGGLYERDFSDANFSNSTTIDNPYWPLIPGMEFTYFAETDDGCEWNRVTVTDYTYEILGIDTVVVEDKEWLDEAEDCADRYDDYPTGFPYGELTEETDDWYAQDELQNIWYMGEDTSSYDWEEGECDVVDGDACKDGSFEAGVGEAEAGIVMMGDPSKGDFYQQEYDPENAEDMGKVLNFVEIDDMDCLKTKEWTALEPGAVEHKLYCYDESLEYSVLYLINEVSGGPTISVELIDVDIP
jgi:hypothetical protein